VPPHKEGGQGPSLKLPAVPIARSDRFAGDVRALRDSFMVATRRSLHLTQKAQSARRLCSMGRCSTPRGSSQRYQCLGRHSYTSLRPVHQARVGPRRDRFLKGQSFNRQIRPRRQGAYPADGCGDAVVPSGVSVAPLERAASIQIPTASLKEYAYRSAPALVRSSSAPAPRLSCPHNPASTFVWESRRRSRRIE
jgi:hypothetical protein